MPILLSSRPALVVGAIVLLTLGLTVGSTYSAPLAAPVDLVAPEFATELGGGYSLRGSPTVADILPNQPGLEIIIGTGQNVPAKNGWPASVAAVSAKGSLLWEVFTYPHNGQIYEVGTVSGKPAIADLDGDGSLDIVVGLGGWENPITRGGVLALEANGDFKWYHETLTVKDDDGIPDGVYTSPSVADFDQDGRQEVVFGGFDQFLWILDGATGQPEPGFPLSMWDTVNSSTAVADLNDDGYPDYTFGSDFANGGDTPEDDVSQLPPDGGIMRGMTHNNGNLYLPGWDECVSDEWACVPDPDNNNLLIPIGQWINQTPFSSPAVADINLDGALEIVMGSGYYWRPATDGHWLKIWRADGTLLATLETNGPMFASPALADLDGDGYLDIVAGSLSMANGPGNLTGPINGPSTLYAWSGNPADNFGLLWSPRTIGTWLDPAPGIGLFASPIIADIDPTVAGPEILVNLQTEVTVFSGSTGEQLTYVANGVNQPTLSTFGFLENSPVVADIDEDGRLEIIAATEYALPLGSPVNHHTWIVAWEWPRGGLNATADALPWPMFRGDLPNHATINLAGLSLSRESFGFAYPFGSGQPDPGFSVTIGNQSQTANLSYEVSYTDNLLAVNGPNSGRLEPGSSIDIPVTVLASQQITGAYTANIQVSGEDDNGLTYEETIVVSFMVGDIQAVYLPLLLSE